MEREISKIPSSKPLTACHPAHQPANRHRELAEVLFHNAGGLPYKLSFSAVEDARIPSWMPICVASATEEKLLASL